MLGTGNFSFCKGFANKITEPKEYSGYNENDYDPPNGIHLITSSLVPPRHSLGNVQLSGYSFIHKIFRQWKLPSILRTPYHVRKFRLNQRNTFHYELAI